MFTNLTFAIKFHSIKFNNKVAKINFRPLKLGH